MPLVPHLVDTPNIGSISKISIKSRIYKSKTMKFGMRTPSFKKSFRARTSGRVNRAIKKAIIPGYGRKGMGILHPKKALYNRVYRRTTFSIFDLAKLASSGSKGSSNSGCCLTLLFWISAIALTAMFL
jgi:hypothetical protein